MPKKETYPPKDKIELFDKLIATNPKVERKGKTMPFTSVNTYMFTHLSKEGILGIRLPKEEGEKFIKKYTTKPYKQFGMFMREFYTVPDKLLKNTKELKKYLDISFKYTKTLKPKK